MLQVDLVQAGELEKAARLFNRDGFVAVAGALNAEQLKLAQAGAQRVIEQQTAETALEKANRGFARYSFGNQMHHPEWQMLIDLPGIISFIDHIWGSSNYRCMGGGGDYSVPGAEIQPLHSDIGDCFKDPWNQTTIRDVPAPFIVVNFLLVDFTVENGAIRFVPCTQRSRLAPPAPADEPQWMRNCHLCAPAGTAVIRDVRCWHAGTANTSQQVRPMSSVGYYAPWYAGADGFADEPLLSRADYNRLSPRGQQLARTLVGA